MQKQPFPFEIEMLTMFTIILVVYVIEGGWHTALVGFLVICLWFITGENGFYHGYTHHNKHHGKK